MNSNFIQSTVERLELYAPKPWQLGFQKPATATMEGVVFFHDDLFAFLTFICFFVLYMLWACLYLFSKSPKVHSIKFVHASTLEVVWTIIPALILIIIAIPSFSLLYSIDEVIEPLFTFKTIGHQWYWSYELIDNENFQALFNSFVESTSKESASTNFSVLSTEGFDSYLVPEDELETRGPLFKSNVRLLTVDNHLLIPTQVPTRIMVSSADVLHSWAVPSLGLKLDACPGRLNQTSVIIKRSGIYYGQCSEICGVNHGFMPIGIVAIDFSDKYSSNLLSRELISTIDPLIAGLVTVGNEN